MTQLMLLASICNIVFDYIAIVALGWGVKGAAYATISAHAFALIIGGIWVAKGHLALKLRATIDLQRMGAIMLLGSPVLVAQAGTAVQSGLVNLQFASLGEVEWVIAYGILGRYAMVAFLPIIAMLIAFQTICSFNHGAGQVDRVRQSIVVAFTAVTIYASVITLILVLFPSQLLSLFATDLDLIGYGKTLIYQTVWGLPLVGVTIIATGYYQSLGLGGKATIYSAVRIFILFMPLVNILPSVIGVYGILIALLLADLLSPLVVGWLCRKELKRIFWQEAVVSYHAHES
ncbi:MATE family efflux transporter [Enterovibrio nigricans]|uniref:MatE protein n=1 Tax=Enterovibrio nigricans DSM 22720 TaxID=1121868 RepID=A0A1T4UCI7_9GAMM|nr:MATE family efflux transporter [Enterovibrio nigricans]PKF51481.1 hypothetical protein AT251_03685 [Enterovibrio nigricans]SKA50171.1 MatE protein [Enterovibrio nigricans DSM 22720]